MRDTIRYQRPLVPCWMIRPVSIVAAGAGSGSAFDIAPSSARYIGFGTGWPLASRPAVCSDLMRAGRVARALDLPPVDPAEDRMMRCGSPAMPADLTDWAEVQAVLSRGESFKLPA